jgi:hypothetical protein
MVVYSRTRKGRKGGEGEEEAQAQANAFSGAVGVDVGCLCVGCHSFVG